jgi:chaperonin GroEL
MNVKTGEFGDMMKMGVIDPTLVTKSALKNAVSVATTIMMSQVIVTNMREGDAS